MKRRGYLGLVGNGETAGLIAPDLAIVWLCLPRFDGTPVFASALDPKRGGTLALCVVGESGSLASLSPAGQSYVGLTAVLRTTARCPGWEVAAKDWMPWGERSLVREIRVRNTGAVPSACRIRALVCPTEARPFTGSVTDDSDGLLVRTQDAVLAGPSGIATEGVPTSVLAPGAEEILRICFAYGSSEAEARAEYRRALEADLTTEMAFWSSWLGRAQSPTGPLRDQWLEMYYRSLIVLKLLSYTPTGAMIAAPTASFPAVPGGSDNWDYRYVWLRDGYYAAMTLDAAGLHEEAERFYDFAFGLQGPDGHWTRPLFDVAGQNPKEFVVEDLSGPGGEKPIRFGNAASNQLQLDNEGNIVHGLWFHYQSGGGIEALRRHWERVRRACEWTACNWDRFESGIWELREYTAHWVHGKAMCFAALQSGAAIAETLGHSEPAIRWRGVAERVREHVVTGGWDSDRQAYLCHYGEGSPPPRLDISVLALVFYGLLPADDPRIRATVSQMERDQVKGGLSLYRGVCRYERAAVPFFLPTIWLARYYLMAGRTADCDRLLQVCADCATDLGLMAEHFDGRFNTQWGNFPQSFSHEEWARIMLERSVGRVFSVPTLPPAGSLQTST